MSTQTFTLTDAQQVPFSLQFFDGANNQITILDTPTYTVDNPSLLTLQLNSGNTSGNIITSGPLGTANVVATVDSVSQRLMITVAPSGLVSISFVLGAATTRLA